MIRRTLLAGVCVLLSLTAGGVATAHETDQFLMPPDPAETRFADMGRYFSEFFGDALRETVEEVNQRIDRAEKANPKRKVRSVIGKKKRMAARHQGESLSPDHYRQGRVVASMMRRNLPDALLLIDGLEWNPPDMTQYGYASDDLVIYKPHNDNAMHTDLHFALDPRIVGRLWRTGTYQAYGSFMGADKIGHFVDMGYHYYKTFDRSRRGGDSMDDALLAAVRFGTHDPLAGENTLLGRFTAGAFSNADMCSNYLGMLFYINLTEPVMLKGQMRPAMLELNDEGRWQVAEHVANDPDFFRWFLSDHYNEALNPSHFERSMQGKVQKAIAARWHRVAQWYADEQGVPRSRNWFNEQAQELSTYYGQDYGHCEMWDELYHLGNVAPEGEDAEALVLDR